MEKDIVYKEDIFPLRQRLDYLISEIKNLQLEIIQKKYANQILYSDVHPYEVVKEATLNKFIIRAMNYELKNAKELKDSFEPGGFIGHTDNSIQKWDITENENAVEFSIRRHKDGNWYDLNGNKYVISDKPVQFRDFNF